MPKKEIDYSKTVIYKIVCNDLNITDVYVGHTTSFTKRKAEHKSKVSNINGKCYNRKIYVTIRENGGWDNWTMVEIEKYNCNDKLEACKRERHYYELLNSTLNIKNPSRTEKEWRVEYKILNKDRIKTYFNKYFENNREKLLAYKREWYKQKTLKEKEEI